MATAQEEITRSESLTQWEGFQMVPLAEGTQRSRFHPAELSALIKARRVVSAILARRVPLMPKQNLLILGLIFTFDH